MALLFCFLNGKQRKELHLKKKKARRERKNGTIGLISTVMGFPHPHLGQKTLQSQAQDGTDCSLKLCICSTGSLTKAGVPGFRCSKTA